MNDRSPNTQAAPWVQRTPGDPVLKGVNWGGLKTLYIKEVRRFFKVQMQTVWAPADYDLALSRDFHRRFGPRRADGDGIPHRGSFAEFHRRLA